MPTDDFNTFLTRVRAGDDQAATELFQQYEKSIRREIRFRLSQSLRRTHDEEDVCQSVFRSFFTRTALGQYDLADPTKLLQLLSSMARNKAAAVARSAHARKRGGGNVHLELDDQALVGNGVTGIRIAAGKELVGRVRERLNEEERRVADLRGEGYNWTEIAKALGGSPDGRRMQFKRALNRVGQELGLKESDD